MYQIYLVDIYPTGSLGLSPVEMLRGLCNAEAGKWEDLF